MHLRQKVRFKPELRPKFLPTFGPNPTRKARPDLQLCCSWNACSDVTKIIHYSSCIEKNLMYVLPFFGVCSLCWRLLFILNFYFQTKFCKMPNDLFAPLLLWKNIVMSSAVFSIKFWKGNWLKNYNTIVWRLFPSVKKSKKNADFRFGKLFALHASTPKQLQIESSSSVWKKYFTKTLSVTTVLC